MLKRTATVIFLFLFGVTLLGQNKHTLKPIGSAFIKGQDREAVRLTEREIRNRQTFKTPGPRVINNVTGEIDTLSYQNLLGLGNSGWNVNFSTTSQDIMMQFYVAPTDLIIHSVGVSYYENAGDVQASIKLVKFTGRTLEELMNAGTTYQGYYPSAGDGYDNIGATPDEATGDWVEGTAGYTDPFTGSDYDLWSDGGFGWPINPVVNAEGEYNWVDMSNLTGDPANDPTVAKGEIFAIVSKNEGTTLGDLSLNYWAYDGSTDYRGWKFYEDGRNVTGSTPPGDGGWWSRDYIWNMAAVVEYTGDLAPTISNLSELLSTISTGARTVTADIVDTNPSGGASGVTSATIKYTVDGGSTWSDVAMTNTGGDTYSGDIPGQGAGTEVSYYVEAADVNSNVAQSATSYTYTVFAPTPGIKTLLVFNGLGTVNGYPAAYYFGDWPNSYFMDFDHDSWAYGPLSILADAGLLDNYTNIIEICTFGPADINNDVIKTWLAGDATRNYMLAGDEYLGTITNWTDTTYQAGDFQFDVLGVNADHNDVSYAVSGDQQLPSIVYPQMGSLLGGPLYDLYTSVSTDSVWDVPMTVDPYYEMGASNWLDGVDFESDVEVDMQGLAIDGSTVYNIGGHRTLTAGNKIAFLTFDPLSLDSDTENEVQYYWYGNSSASVQDQVLHWFGADVVGVEKTNNNIPAKFSLSQNYPNPFNPTTLINYDIPNAGNVTIAIYDVLGRKVTELVNTFQQAGSYKVSWDGTNQYGNKVTSGAYFYQLRASNGFIETKKMVLLK